MTTHYLHSTSGADDAQLEASG